MAAFAAMGDRPQHPTLHHVHLLSYRDQQIRASQNWARTLPQMPEAVYLRTLRAEDGLYDEDSLRRDGVIRFDCYAEHVWPIHPLVHHCADAQLAGLAWLQGRRTDDRFRRSAALDGFDFRLVLQDERRVAHIAVDKVVLNQRVQGHCAEIETRFVEHQTRSFVYYWSWLFVYHRRRPFVYYWSWLFVYHRRRPFVYYWSWPFVYHRGRPSWRTRGIRQQPGATHERHQDYGNQHIR